MKIRPFVPLVSFIGVSVLVVLSCGYTIGILFLLVVGYAYAFLGIGNKPAEIYSYEHRQAKPNETAPRRMMGFDELRKTPFEGVNTLRDNFLHGVQLSGNLPCLGTRPSKDADYVWETYNEVNQRILNFGAGLAHLGLERHDRVGFYSKNSAEWVIGAESCNAFAFVSVAVYDTLGEEHRPYVVGQSEVKALVSTSALFDNVLALAPQCPALKYVILTDPVSPAHKQSAESVNLSVLEFSEVERLGKENFTDPVPPEPTDLAILMYTSGTTSQPKGVMLTHGNVIAVMAGIMQALPNLSNDDSYLSYLPLAHILERAAEATMFGVGARIGFNFQGDIRRLTDDIVAVKPTIYAGVPKVFQRVMAGINAKFASQPIHIRMLFKVLYSLKFRFLVLGLPTGLFDKILFNKLKDALGGRIKTIVSGGAPLGADCHQFLRVCFCCPVLQGYGLTETAGGTAITPISLRQPWEKVGAPICCSEVKLVSAGKYSVNHHPPQGELCVSGPNVALGYYQMPEKTASDFRNEDGEIWFHTGDVGQWNADGTLSIIGRVKDIFKLDGGEYIAPERLETIYSQSKFVANIFVYGNSNQSFIVGVVVPEYGAAKLWAEQNNVQIPDKTDPPTVPRSLCNNADFKKAIIADLASLAGSNKLNRYEMLQHIHLDVEPWTADSGLVTAALKNKREQLYDYYQNQINEFYEN